MLLIFEFCGWSYGDLMDMPVDELGEWWDELERLAKDRAAEQERRQRTAQQRRR